ncbi:MULTISPECIES: DUF1289 domain-containing protein [Massilia]|uniref:Fe-S oxidoreductase n=1 Tax=Massilia aurea TaxID=373040 RepID=A0A422QHI6_9BURK|nr:MULTISPECIES: DUF1289 domain-containing protein [Massilia]MDY0962057.1 DUF1289 domain-containing protein [Massilia sp. CFBP9026]RNF29429.1 Fe-S oxidoreductase [Massilia aurea]
MSARPEDSAAAQEPAPAERPDTPCVAVCSTTFDEVCRGCGRTVAEVAHWVSMDAAAKEVVWQRILAQGYPRRNS